MSCKSKVDSRQVLSHLNQLGYQNITAEQLKEFIKDLKKLIKYEQRKNEPKDSDIENIPPALPYNKLSPIENNIAAPKTPLSARPKQKFISVQIKKSGHGSSIKQSKTSGKSKESSYSTTSNESKVWTIRDRQVQDAQSGTTSDTTKTDTAEIVLTKNTKPSKRAKFQSNSYCSQPSLPLTTLCEPECQKMRPGSRSSGMHQSKASYIVPKRPLKTWKTDPVALYHEYKKFWSTHNFPGENGHAELRWAIRERMLGQPRKQIMSASPSMESVARQRRSSSSIP